MRSSLRRLSLGHTKKANTTGGGITLGEKLAEGEKSVSSGYTDPTERSVTSSVCLSETGQVVVITRGINTNNNGRTNNRKKTSRLNPIKSSAGAAVGVVSASPAKVPAGAPNKPKSQRRRSLFGSSASSTDGSTDLDTSSVVGHPSVEDSSSVAAVPKPRRRSMFGSTTSTPAPMDETIGAKQSQQQQQMQQPAMAKPKSARRRSLFGSSTSSLDHDAGFVPVSSTTTQASLPTTATSKPRSSRRRLSLGGGASGGSSMNADIGPPPPSPVPRKPRSNRRRSLFGGTSTHTVESMKSSTTSRGSTEKKSSSTIATTLSAGAGAPVCVDMAKPTDNNPYDLLNKERAKRSLPRFSRNMLMDSIAKDVSLQMAKSVGSSCEATDYYGNVGKGVSVWAIHQQMMANKATERSLILSPDFSQVGIGMTRRSKDGQLFLCQLFK